MGQKLYPYPDKGLGKPVRAFGEGFNPFQMLRNFFMNSDKSDAK